MTAEEHHKCQHEPKVASIKCKGKYSEFFVDVCNDCKNDPLFERCGVITT